MVIKEEGSLGLAFADYGDDKPAELEDVKKKGLAYAANPKLAAGMVRRARLTIVHAMAAAVRAHGGEAPAGRRRCSPRPASHRILGIPATRLSLALSAP